MLKKAYRLSSVKLENPKTIYSSTFSIKTAKNGLDIPRFGFVISKRIDTRANVRNSAKRKLSMCIEQIFDRIDAGYDFVFILKANIDNVPRENLLEEIGNALKKERLLND